MTFLYNTPVLGDSPGRQHIFSDPYSDLSKEFASRTTKAHRIVVVASISASCEYTWVAFRVESSHWKRLTSEYLPA